MKSWQDISKDPTSKEVIHSRMQEVQTAESPQLISDRINYICDLAKGKDVLDVGIVDHIVGSSQSDSWLHRHLCEVSKSCVGVDILEEEINHLKTLDFDVISMDITQDILDQKFDLIVCGEVLEHLEKPGYLFKNAVQMLKDGGRLIIAVPNPWYASVVLHSVLKGFYYLDNVDHIAWFDPCTMFELGQKNGLRLDCFRGITIKDKSALTMKARLFFELISLFVFIGFRPLFFAKSIIYEFILEK